MEVKAWMDQGVDLATETGDPLKVTLFHRLAKLIGKDSSLTDKQRVAPLFFLSDLTNGKALAPEFSEAWGSLGTSYAATLSRPTFREDILRAFMKNRGPQEEIGSEKALHTWKEMKRTAFMLDRPDLLDELLAIAPKNLPALNDLFYGGVRVMEWLKRNYGEEIKANSPTHQSLGIGGLSIPDYIEQHDYGFSLTPAMAAWRQAIDREGKLDQALPQAACESLKKTRPGPRI